MMRIGDRNKNWSGSTTDQNLNIFFKEKDGWYDCMNTNKQFCINTCKNVIFLHIHAELDWSIPSCLQIHVLKSFNCKLNKLES